MLPPKKPLKIQTAIEKKTKVFLKNQLNIIFNNHKSKLIP